ncbi:hypothetical protein BGZ63DRAFT_406887 [Mariannaea sp. PMI_226]|nr:hypothetical protein BGZ63DRAFT_406887 [Mariannaea sp. PMI_226]
MKIAFFSVLALAVSVFAAPVAEAEVAVRDTSNIQKAVDLVESIDTRSLDVAQPSNLDKRSVSSSVELIAVLKTCGTNVKVQCSLINEVVVQYKKGYITRDQCCDKSISYFKQCITLINIVISKCSGTGVLTVIASEVDVILKLVVLIVTEILTCVKAVVSACGLTSKLTILLNSLIVIICKLLVVVIAIVAEIVPGLCAALHPLVSSLGGLLGIVLTPLVLLLAGLLL